MERRASLVCFSPVKLANKLECERKCECWCEYLYKFASVVLSRQMIYMVDTGDSQRPPVDSGGGQSIRRHAIAYSFASRLYLAG